MSFARRLTARSSTRVHDSSVIVAAVDDDDDGVSGGVAIAVVAIVVVVIARKRRGGINDRRQNRCENESETETNCYTREKPGQLHG